MSECEIKKKFRLKSILSKKLDPAPLGTRTGTWTQNFHFPMKPIPQPIPQLPMLPSETTSV